MKRKKRLALLLTMALCACLVGCGGEKPSQEEDDSSQGGGEEREIPDYLNMDSALPIVKEGTDITLRVMIVEGTMYANMDSIHDVYFVDAYEKKTGIHIEWEEVSMDAFADRLALQLTTGDLPDVILKGGVSNSSQLKYGEQGFFLNLMEDDLLETYAPNYWALCRQYPEILASSRMPDGSIYSLGTVKNSTGSTIASKLFFNKEWLEKLGLSTPATADEFYNVLYQFKNGDPNGNGMADEVGLYIKPDHLQYVTFGMFGIGNRGRNNGYIDWDQEKEQVRFFATSDGFRQWVEWVHKLYAEGLLNQEYYDFTEGTLGSYLSNDVCGAFAYTNLSMVSQKVQQRFTYLDGAMTGSGGYKDYYGINSLGSTGSYIITTACRYPEAALRWADYLYSDEGCRFLYYGDEGVTYTALEDGTYQYTDQVLADYYSGSNSYDGCAVYVSLYGYGNTPTMTKIPYNSTDDNRGIALEAANALIEDCAIAWPSFTFTTKEQRIIEDQKKDIDAYVASMRDAWIMGNIDLTDASWEQYVKTIESMGVADVLEVYEAALQRAYDGGFVEGRHTFNEYE